MNEDSTYHAFVRAIDLREISLVEGGAKRTGDIDPDQEIEAKLSLESAQRVAESEIDYKFKFVCEVSQAGGPIATISATYVASYGSEGRHEADEEIVLRFAQDVAIMAVYPYMREFAQSMAARLDIPKFTMGLIKRGELVIASHAAGDNGE